LAGLLRARRGAQALQVGGVSAGDVSVLAGDREPFSIALERNGADVTLRTRESLYKEWSSVATVLRMSSVSLAAFPGPNSGRLICPCLSRRPWAIRK